MELNRETAMRLWAKSFGKETKVKDYTGRIIAKGAYNDRNSEFGWNLDHILPQSKGGKTADHNLVCCHILTNDEKADKFPGFKANGNAYEIVKVENHYEIRQVDNKKKKTPTKPEESGVNFMDSAAGVHLFKRLKEAQDRQQFVGTVFIRLKKVQTTALVNFISRLFEDDNMTYSMKKGHTPEMYITIRNYDVPLKADVQAVLDKCILLNTYMHNYFIPLEYVDKYDIFYRVNCYSNNREMYEHAQDDVLKNECMSGMYCHVGSTYTNMLYISNLVICNTDAKDEVEADRYTDYAQYDYRYTRLEKNLNKLVDREG